MKIIKLGEMVTDRVTDTLGMLTHMCVNMDGHNKYVYQPRGLNPEDGQPVNSLFIEKARIVGGTEEEVDLPLELLDSKVEDIATGFKGTVIELCYHINGCVHAEIKPEGKNEKTGATIAAYNIDIRRLKGDKIKPIDAVLLAESKVKTPSPMGIIPKTQR